MTHCAGFAWGFDAVMSPLVENDSFRAPKAPRSPAAPKADVNALCQEFQRLYESSSVATVEEIDRAMGKLTGLKKADLVTVAGALDLVGTSRKTATEIVAMIRSRIAGRRSAQRTGMINRPTAEDAETVEAGR